MVQETIIVKEHNSTQAKMGGIIVSAAQTMSSQVTLVVGRPGLPNITSHLTTGGAILFETPDGLFEVRVMSNTMNDVTVLLSQVSPRPGIAGGFVDQDSDNAPFTQGELLKIAASIEQIKQAMNERADVLPEQLDFIARKLVEMQKASERLGRKDWMNYAMGTLTGIITTAAFTPNVRDALLQAAGAALGGGSLAEA